MTYGKENIPNENLEWKEYLLYGDQERVRQALSEQLGIKVFKTAMSYHAKRLGQKSKTEEGKIIRAALIKVARQNKSKIDNSIEALVL